ncbi:hypothetical protein RSAG8_04232, partial [Rhizoctonia solani AG-8 WAC10335]
MIDELRNASNRLRAALDHYVRICSNVQDVCLQGTTPQNTILDYVEQVERELGLVESYDVKMQLAKKAIKVTRNYALNITPINRLPNEILARVFHMARDAEPCSVDHAALVCSRWRTLVLRDPSLWTRVDFHPSICHSFYLSLNRAEAHILRSGEMPLDVHISASQELPKKGYYDSPMKSLCTLAGPRMGSLEINFADFESNELLRTRHSAISTLLLHCQLGLFTKLVTFSDSFGFLTSEQPGPGIRGIPLEVEHSHLEAVLASVTALHLIGLYPPWTSQAYHGLVELRLVSSPGITDSIPERGLINILQSSPGIRILQTSLQITDRVEGHLNVSVSLPDLQVLQVDSEAFPRNNLCHLELVRFLSPGLRPLDFTMQCNGLQLSESSKAQTKAFLARSNVTQFHADQVLCPYDILSLMPHLKALILSNCEPLPVGQSGLIEYSDEQGTPSVIYPKLDVCLILECALSLDEFRATIQRCQVQTLMIYSSKFLSSIDGQVVNTGTAMKELSDVCPDVKIRNIIPRFVEHQNVFFDYSIP